jgi:hypothetical protein
MRSRRLIAAGLLVGAVVLSAIMVVLLLPRPPATDGVRPGEFVRVLVPIPIRDGVGGAEIDDADEGARLFVVGGPRLIGEVAWYRVEHFSRNGSSPFALARFGWIGVPVHEAVLAEYQPGCPDTDEPLEIGELALLNPAEVLHCVGGSGIRIAPAIVRHESPEIFEEASPDWLADQPGLQIYGRHGWNSNDGSLGGHVLPGSPEVPLEEWLEVRGHFDDPASAGCLRTPLHPEFGPISAEDAALWCRQQFVIDAVAIAEAPEPAPGPIVAGGAWTRLPPAPIEPRSGHSGVWTGEEMIVWGGYVLVAEGGAEPVAPTNDGGAFNPTSGGWREIAPAPIPPRSGHVAVWTGREMLVWGGWTRSGKELVGGGRYRPSDDTWAEMPAAPLTADSDRMRSAIWDGERLIAWVGPEVAAFDPVSGGWESLPSIPVGDVEGAALAGDSMTLFALVYPHGGDALVEAFALHAGADAWTALPEPPLQALVADRTPIWTGERLLTVQYSWHQPPDSIPPETLYAAWFEPASGRWSVVLSEHYFEPSIHVWTGEVVYFVWGLGQFNEATGEWAAIPDSPDARREAAPAVWTGESLIIWGGTRGESFRPLEDGWAFTPE